MRLIDGDALKMYMRNALETTRQCYPDWGEWAETITEEFCKDIDEQPTIEPERKTGQWLPMFNGAFRGGAYWFECSECKRIVPEVRNEGWGYCPNCGAKMEKGEQK